MPSTALAYLGGIANRPVAPAPDAVIRLDELDFDLPATGLTPMDMLGKLDSIGSPRTVRRLADGMRAAGLTC